MSFVATSAGATILPAHFPTVPQRGICLGNSKSLSLMGKNGFLWKFRKILKKLHHFSGDCIKTLKLWVSMVSKSLSKRRVVGTSVARVWHLAHWRLEQMKKHELQPTLMTYNIVLTNTDKYWKSPGSCNVHCGSETLGFKNAPWEVMKTNGGWTPYLWKVSWRAKFPWLLSPLLSLSLLWSNQIHG